jgi:hypothetical protein
MIEANKIATTKITHVAKVTIAEAAARTPRRHALTSLCIFAPTQPE